MDWSIHGLKTASGASGPELESEFQLESEVDDEEEETLMEVCYASYISFQNIRYILGRLYGKCSLNTG